MKFRVEYWKLPHGDYDSKKLTRTTFINRHGDRVENCSVSRKDVFTKLEAKYEEQDDGIYVHIIWGMFRDWTSIIATGPVSYSSAPDTWDKTKDYYRREYDRKFKRYSRYVFKVYPKGRSDIYSVIEMSEKHSLDDFCQIILYTFDLDNNHLYEFCMDNQIYSDNSYQYIPDKNSRRRIKDYFSEPDNYIAETNITFKKLNLAKNQTFLLHYDFIADRLFTIRVQRIYREEKRNDPVIIRKAGRLPHGNEYDEF